MNKIAMLCGAIALSTPFSAFAFSDADCSAILPTTVHVTEEYRNGETIVNVRLRALNRAAQQAVLEKAGIALRSQRAQASGIATQSNGDAVSKAAYSKFESRAMAQSSGLVRYKVMNETTIDAASAKQLVVSIDANVCIPASPDVLKPVIAFGETLSSRGQDLPIFRDILASTFSSTKSFIVAADDQIFRDAVITGRINTVEIKIVENGPNPSLSGKPSIIGGRDPTAFQRLNASVTLQATYEDGAVITSALSDSANIPINADPADAIQKRMPEILKKASLDLLSKMEAAKAQHVSAPVIAKPASAAPNISKPRW